MTRRLRSSGRATRSLLVVLMATVAAAVAFAFALTSASADPTPTMAERFSVLEERTPSGLASMSEIKRSQRTAGTQSTETALPVGTELFDPAAAREADVNSGAGRVWAAPSKDGAICVLLLPSKSDNLGPASSCALPKPSDEGSVITHGGGVMGSAPRQVAAGIVPNGVKQVTASFADGSTQDLKVVDNAFVGEFSQPAVSLTYRQGSNTVNLLAGIEIEG